MNQTNKKKILNDFTVMTMSVPKLNSAGFKIANASTFYTNDLKFDLNQFLTNMYRLNLNKFQVFCILTDENILPSTKSQNYYNDSNIEIKQILSITYISSNDFFKLDTINFLFHENKEKSFEYIFVFNTQD